MTDTLNVGLRIRADASGVAPGVKTARDELAKLDKTAKDTTRGIDQATKATAVPGAPRAMVAEHPTDHGRTRQAQPGRPPPAASARAPRPRARPSIRWTRARARPSSSGRP